MSVFEGVVFKGDVLTTHGPGLNRIYVYHVSAANHTKDTITIDEIEYDCDTGKEIWRRVAKGRFTEWNSYFNSLYATYYVWNVNNIVKI